MNCLTSNFELYLFSSISTFFDLNNIFIYSSYLFYP